MSAWVPSAHDREDFASKLRDFAETESKPELAEKYQGFVSELSPLQLFAWWFDVVIPVLREQLGKYTTGEGPLEVEEDPLDAHIRVWNLLGDLAINNGQPTFARDLFTTLLRDLRAIQPKRGRVHKGTPYHQIGRSLLAAGEVNEAHEYFICAVIEDLIRDGGAANLNSPAAQTLQIQYGETTAFFEELDTRLSEMASRKSYDAALKQENPELLFIDPGRAGTIKSSRQD